MSSKAVKLLVLLVFMFLLVIFALISFRWVSVDGHERVVWQRVNGIDDQIGEPGMHFYFHWTTTPHRYEISNDTFIIDDQTTAPTNKFMNKKEHQFNEPDAAPIIIPVMMEHLTEADKKAGKATGPTPVKVNVLMQYHLDPSKIIELHKTCTPAYRTTLIMPILVNTIISKTTILDARTVYQGEGRVKLQGLIEETLKADQQLKDKGVVIEQFVIRQIHLEDQDFAAKMTAEARAEQDRKTAEKQKIAYDATAEAERSKAMAEQNKRLVEADTCKGEEIKKAEADNRKKVLAADASMQQAVLAATGEAQKIKLEAQANMERQRLEGEGLKLRKIAEAEGVLALGKSTAEAQRLMLETFKGEGGLRYAEVEKAKALGTGIQKIYYVPSTMSINAIAKDFMGAVTIGLPQAPVEK